MQLNRLRDKPPCLTAALFDGTDVQVADAGAWLGAPRPIGGGCRAGHSDDDLSVAAQHHSAATRGRFAAVGPAGRRHRSIAARPALSSKC